MLHIILIEIIKKKILFTLNFINNLLLTDRNNFLKIIIYF